jgi:hypothetical protein
MLIPVRMSPYFHIIKNPKEIPLFAVFFLETEGNTNKYIPKLVTLFHRSLSRNILIE